MLVLLFLLLINITSEVPDILPPKKWVVQKNSVFSIDGKSNVAAFTCQTVEYPISDTLLTNADAGTGKPLSFFGNLNIKVKWFNCNQSLMTREMYQTLKEKERPYMKIKLLEVESFSGNARKVKSKVEVELAGTAKQFDILLDVEMADSKSLNFIGEKNMKFSDFNLKPPSKLAGMVRVDENILVKFKIKLKEVS